MQNSEAIFKSDNTKPKRKQYGADPLSQLKKHCMQEK